MIKMNTIFLLPAGMYAIQFGINKMGPDNLASISAMIGGGFFSGLLIGWALKKVIKLLAIADGIFLTGLAYLQYQQVVSINWDKVEGVSERVIIIITNTASSITAVHEQDTISQAMTNFGIPLTSSLSTGFAIGFMKE